MNIGEITCCGDCPIADKLGSTPSCLTNWKYCRIIGDFVNLNDKPKCETTRDFANNRNKLFDRILRKWSDKIKISIFHSGLHDWYIGIGAKDDSEFAIVLGGENQFKTPDEAAAVVESIIKKLDLPESVISPPDRD